MIERDVLPTGCCMTCRTDRAKLSVMRVLGGVTGITILGCAFINSIDMTCLTLGVDVGACQRETCFAMIETYIFPTARVVTGCAIRAKLTIVRVLLGMARITIFGRSFEHIVHVAG